MFITNVMEPAKQKLEPSVTTSTNQFTGNQFVLNCKFLKILTYPTQIKVYIPMNSIIRSFSTYILIFLS